MLPTKNKLPLSKALFYIFLSVMVISGVPTFIWSSYRYHQKERNNNPKFALTNFVQTGPIKEALKSEHLEELLGLSLDRPQNLFAFDLDKAKAKLLQSGVIKDATLSIEQPNTLVIDYTAREPMAYISDYTNLVVDQDGTLFPLAPYYTPKLLPKIYLGIKMEHIAYGKLEDEKFQVAKGILTFFKKLDMKSQTVQKIDVSGIRAESIGKQEIVVMLTEELGKKRYLRYLRLSPESYLDEIEHYLTLKQMSMPEDLIIDLRLLPNAYLMPVSEANSI